MCGICGIINLNTTTATSAKETVKKMNDAIIHRGPDGAGYYHNAQCHLAMRRLSIIDLNSGDQPIWNEDRSICVLMNGEIYNYIELRADLITKGHQFYTQSDTEVLVHLYEEYGPGFSQYLKGMFTYVLCDTVQEKFLLSRDRFGEKPLYYHYENGVLSFSSEVASLLQNTAIKRILDTKILNYYLASAYVPDPHTLLKGIKTLPPGHELLITEKGLKIKPYFTIDYRQNDKLITNFEEAATFIKPYLTTAIERQSRSDVPFGAFLSGGIDSSTVCALLQEQSATKIDTFTVKFEEANYDESPIAVEVAERIGSQHHEITIPNGEFTEEMFWRIIDHVGLPFPDSSAIPVYHITKEIRKHVKVALSGDGGDEIFAGYPDFGWWQKAQKATKIPVGMRKGMLHLLRADFLPFNKNMQRKLHRGLQASMKGEKAISLEIHRMFFDTEMDQLLSADAPKDYPYSTDTPKGFAQWSPLRKSMYHRIKHKLPNDMLIKLDRMSMANSLEVRAPFLDPDLFIASLQLSDNLLYDGKLGKKIIRHLMKDKLPTSVFEHPKSGFSIPLHKYENAAYRNIIREVINKDNPIFHLFNADALQHFIQQQSVNNSKTSVFRASHQLWTLVQLFAWVKRFNIHVA